MCECRCHCRCECEERPVRPQLPPARIVELDEKRGFVSVRKTLFGGRVKIVHAGRGNISTHLYSREEAEKFLRALEMVLHGGNHD